MAKAQSCHHCVYSRWDRNQAMWTMSVGVALRPACANQPGFPGRMKECPSGRVCNNFRARPPTPKGETVKTIPLGDGFYAYVDAADFEWLNQWTWYLNSGYAVRRENNRVISMHRQIMQPPKGMVVDHKNRNKLDNTRENMETTTAAKNALNRSKPRNTSSRFWGVSYIKERAKYQAFVWYRKKAIACGYFMDEIEAARAHDAKAVELLGESAQLNFPEEWPEERRKAVGATHASPVRGKSKRTKAGARKTEGRGRKTDGPKKSKKADRKTHDARRATKSARATGHEGRGRAKVRRQKERVKRQKGGGRRQRAGARRQRSSAGTRAGRGPRMR